MAPKKNLIGRPNGYDSAAVLYLEGQECDDLGADCGGTVEVWSDAHEAKKRSEYIQGLLKEVPFLGTEFHYLDGPTLLRVTGEASEAQTRALEAALRN